MAKVWSAGDSKYIPACVFHTLSKKLLICLDTFLFIELHLSSEDVKSFISTAHPEATFTPLH